MIQCLWQGWALASNKVIGPARPGSAPSRAGPGGPKGPVLILSSIKSKLSFKIKLVFYIFFICSLRSTIFSRFSGVRADLKSLKVRPAELQCLSGSAEETGIAYMLLATFDKRENLDLHSYQNLSGSV